MFDVCDMYLAEIGSAQSFMKSNFWNCLSCDNYCLHFYQFLAYSVVRILNALAGFPARIVLLGNDFVTTDPAPTMQ